MTNKALNSALNFRQTCYMKQHICLPMLLTITKQKPMYTSIKLNKRCPLCDIDCRLYNMSGLQFL